MKRVFTNEGEKEVFVEYLHFNITEKSVAVKIEGMNEFTRNYKDSNDALKFVDEMRNTQIVSDLRTAV